MGQSASAARISDVFVKRDPTEKDTPSNSEASEIAHLRIKADSAELEKKNIQLLLRSEQQKSLRLQVALDQLQNEKKRGNTLSGS